MDYRKRKYFIDGKKLFSRFGWIVSVSSVQKIEHWLLPHSVCCVSKQKISFFGVHTKLKSLHFTTLMFRYLLIDTHWKYRICQGAQHTLAIINLNLTWSREVRLSDIIITNRRLICFSYSFNSVTLPKIFFQWLISPAAHVNELYETFRLQVNT